MKALKVLIFAMALFFAGSVQAQVTINIGTPPLWGPAGYPEVRYYYLPDVEAFYDIQSSMFVYYGPGVWVRSAYLPARYKDYDLYGGYKVVLSDYHGNQPYTHFYSYKKKYAKGYRGQPQQSIGQKPEKPTYNANLPGKGNSHNKVSPGNNKNNGQNGNKGGNGKKK
jgi:hypothetical protein